MERLLTAGRFKVPCLILASLLSFIVYWQTLAPTITWRHDGADGGDLLSAIYTLGIPHPNGFPLYVLLGQIFAKLPFPDPAFRINLASAFCAVLATAIVYLINYELTKSCFASFIASLIFATSFTFWSQALITEVYTLHVLLISAVVYLFLRWYQVRSTQLCHLAFFVFGLSLTNHLTSFLLLPAIFYLLWATLGKKTLNFKFLIRNFLFLLLGFSLYLYLPLRARAHPLAYWGDISTLSGFVNHITAASYRKFLFDYSLFEVFDNFLDFWGLSLKNFGYLGVILAATGFYHVYDNQRKLASFLTIGFISFAFFNINYKVATIKPYFLPCFFIFSLFIGTGVKNFLEFFGGLRLEMVVAVILVFVFGVKFSKNYPGVDLSQDREAAKYGGEAFAVLPQGSIVLAESDRFIFTLLYFQRVVNTRLDVLVTGTSFGLDANEIARIQRYYPQIVVREEIVRTHEEELKILEEFIENNLGKHAIFLTLQRRAQVGEKAKWGDFELQAKGSLYEVVR